MRPAVGGFAATLFFAALIPVVSAGTARHVTYKFPHADQIPVTQFYVQDLAALLVGSHRVAADLAYVQILQYYGKTQHEEEFERYNMPGNYPLLKEYTQRFMRLDPYFNGGILEFAGALGFMEKESDQALDVLKEAIALDPSYFRYGLYIAAILYKNQGNDAELIRTLQKAVEAKDCPPLLQGVLGNLLKKNGRYEEAALVYLHTVQTATAASDRKIANERLQRLIREHPEVSRAVMQEIGRSTKD